MGKMESLDSYIFVISLLAGLEKQYNYNHINKQSVL